MNYSTALVQLPLVCEAGAQKITSPADAYRVCADIASLAQESFHILSLNAKNTLINRHLITLGLVDSAPVHPREVFREAVRQGASAVVLVHNRRPDAQRRRSQGHAAADRGRQHPGHPGAGPRHHRPGAGGGARRFPTSAVSVVA